MRGLIDQALSYLSDQIVCEMKTLATNVTVSAGATAGAYTLPTKSGYKIGAVTPIVTGGYYGYYYPSITMQNDKPTLIYFRNTHTSAHQNSFYVYMMYIKE